MITEIVKNKLAHLKLAVSQMSGNKDVAHIWAEALGVFSYLPHLS